MTPFLVLRLVLIIINVLWGLLKVCIVAYVAGVYLLGVYVSVRWAAKRLLAPATNKLGKVVGTLGCTLIGLAVFCTGISLIVGAIQNVSDLMPSGSKKANAA